MTNKCIGCGSYLQVEDPGKIGYTLNQEKNLCNRCFRIQHYNEYQKVMKENRDFISILNKINESNDLVILVIDLFLFHKDLKKISRYIQNDVLLVLTKRDVFPKKIKDEKFIEYFQDFPLHIVDTEVISSLKNYNFDSLYAKINIHKKTNNIYVIGYTNAGKSTMMNQLLYNYSDKNAVLTTSMMPSTTLDCISLQINDELTLIDTPGLLVEKSLMNEVPEEVLKKIMPKKEIKPITYQIKETQYVNIEDFLQIEIINNNITLYLSNQLNIKRTYQKKDGDYPHHKKIKVKKNEDLVIEGLGFIKGTCDSVFTVASKYDIKIYTRKNLI